MLNLNLNTLSSKLTEQQRGAFTGLVSASFVLYGGGGAGDNTGLDSGGGGAAMVVSGSIHMVPNLTYTVIVGGGNSASIWNGTPVQAQSSWIYGSNQLTSIPFTASAGGGFNGGRETGSLNDYFRNGGNSGAGFVYFRPGVTSSYSAYIGGVYGGLPGKSAAGGAGSGQNGANGTGTLAGAGGNGYQTISSSLQTFGYYSSSIVADAPSPILPLSVALGAAGGGMGGTKDLQPSITAFFGGGNADQEYNDAYGPGSAGCGVPYFGAPAGNGGDGRCFIIYCGVPKMDVTNATTTYDAVHNRTIHIFSKGTGSFYFDFEKYGALEGCQ
jgi:hypothetical protein